MAINPEHFEQQLQRVSQNDPDLKRLDFSDCELNQRDITRLAHALVNNTHLTQLDLRGNNIRDDGARALANNTTITTLDLSCNDIEDDGARALANNTTITTLDLSWNDIGDDGAAALANNTTITTLDLSVNDIEDDGARALANNTTITTLDLSWNDIGDDGAAALANNTTITTLDLSGNEIGAEGAAALTNNTKMTALKLSGNEIGAEGAAALANNTTITTLDLSANYIRDGGAAALANNTTITTLNLGTSKIGDEGAAALANNATITTLDLRNNRIGDDGARALANNTTITTLDLRNNRIGDEGARALANNTTITTLDLRNNRIGDDGAAALANNTTIITLDLSYNKIGDDGAIALLAALKKNATLTKLNLFCNDLSDANRQAIKDELQTNQACLLIIKEQIQTLMNIRSTHLGSPLALMPIELMFLFFEELMPGFEPSTFMQQKVKPVNEETMTKARHKLKTIAAQQGLSIKLEGGTKHYYAVTTHALVTKGNNIQFSVEELRQVLNSSTHCYLYTTVEQARQKRLEGTKELMFWRTTTPLEFMVTTSPMAVFAEGMQFKISQLNTIVYLQGPTLKQAELLRACEHERPLKRVVADAYDEYNRVSNSTTSTSSSDTGYSISSTSQLEPRHTTDGVTRALAFKESLEDLKYVELIEKMKDYAAGRFNGGFDPGKSFKAILYVKLIQHYGTQAQRDRLPTVVINREALLAAITEAEKQIKQKVFQDLSLQAHQEAPRQDLVQLTRPGSSPAK